MFIGAVLALLALTAVLVMRCDRKTGGAAEMNIKAGKALSIPPSLLLRADQVIE